jgi:D-alanyl-D-alanine carboxypeptidase
VLLVLVFAPPLKPAAATTGLCAAGPLADSLAAVVEGLADQAQIGLLAVSLDRGDTLLAANPERRMIPGSNAKIFTTSAFLRRYGPAARFTTRVEARGRAQVAAGTAVRLKGDLVLRGSGAPDVAQLLSPGSRGLLDSLAYLLRAGGLVRFEGTLWVDGTLFAAEPYGPGWAIEDAVASYGAAVGAILANGNSAALVATGGTGHVTLAIEPPEAPFILESRTVLSDTARTGWLQAERYPGSPRLIVRGEVPRGGTVRQQIATLDPDSTAGLVLLGAMRRAGIEVKRASVRVVPHGLPEAPPYREAADSGWAAVGKHRASLVLRHDSPAADLLAGVVNAWSLNVEAEALARLLDPAAREKRREAGLGEVRRYAAEAGIDTLDLSLVDGCGLSPQNLATARAVVAWLAAHHRDSVLAAPFRDGLAAPGAPGTLKRRFGGVPAGASLHGKTGTLTNVSSLTGYVRTADGEQLAFAFLSNGNRGSVAEARRAEERFVELLSRFRREAASAAPARIPR